MTSRPILKSSRFEVRQSLGSGGFGVVYEAHDRERDEVVALKVLRRFDAEAIYRLKQEFRSLAGIEHPNLASLYELVFENDQWFFTMELVDGIDFLRWVRRPAPEEDAATDGPTLRFDQQPTLGGSPESMAWPFDERRLRDAARQLAEGVEVLHAHGKLHRDLKPSNVLVTPRGRLVALDFGMVTELSSTSGDSMVGGTPVYMAPEQITRGGLTEATDWYGVGAMLYQALTDELPFRGSVMEVLAHKQTREPTPPTQLVQGLPEDLSGLCMELMARDPAQRPTGSEVLQRLGAGSSVLTAASATVRPAAGAPFLGRDPEERLLAEQFEAVQHGRTVIVHIHGVSGVGKTALVHHFADDLVGRGETIVLRGSCFEQESVPYKALDSIIDVLSRHLKRRTPEELDALRPRYVADLARLFPVLRRVEGLVPRVAPAARPTEIDPQERRRRAFRALREMLDRLGARVPLVLVLDDVQWGDMDSAALLGEVLRPPDPPAFLLLASYRSEARDSSPFVRRLRALETQSTVSEHVDLPIRDLTEADATRLALQLLGDGGAEELARSIARESGGNPFFIQALVRYLEDAPIDSDSDVSEISLEQALRARLEVLPDTERMLLELVAVAGQPTVQHIVSRAGGIDQDAGAFRTLRHAQLIRTRGAVQQDLVEAYHDRVRVAVLATLAPDARREHHGALARSLVFEADPDDELLAFHFRRGGELERAAHHTRAAADNAADALAFDRASSLYRQALELLPEGAIDRRGLKAKLARALANGGRGAEAAPIFLEAGRDADSRDAPELVRSAAEAWLKAGLIEEGVRALRQVLQRVGLRLARTPRRALVMMLWLRLRLRLRGLLYVERDEDAIPADVLERVDVTWVASTGLAMSDFIRGAEYQTRNLLLALDAGEPYRITRALAMEANYAATRGRAGHAHTSMLLHRASEIAERLGHRHARGLVAVTRAMIAYQEGRFRDLYEASDEAIELLRGWPGASWEQSNSRLYAMEGLQHTGRLAELAAPLAEYIEETESRGNWYAALSLRVLGHILFLAADDPDGARREVRQAMEPYTHAGAHIPHYWEFFALGQIDLYRGRGESALRLVDERLRTFKNALLMRVHIARIGAYNLRARCALAAAADPTGERTRILRLAAADARRLRRERSPLGDALVLLINAGLAARHGNPERALSLLEDAERSFRDLEMRLYVASARRQRGLLLGGAAGATLVEEADDAFRAQNVVNPERFAAMIAPGFDGNE